MNEPERMTLGDAARLLGLPYPTAYKAYCAGRVKYERMGSAIIVTLADVQEAFASYKRRGVSSPKLCETVKH